MPLIKVDTVKGNTVDFNKKLMDIICAAMVETLGIPKNENNIRLTEFDSAFFSITEPYKYIVEISMFAGRSDDLKRKLFSAIVTNLKDGLGIKKEAVFILINEQPMENWGIRGGVCAKDIKFNFSIEK